MRRAFEVRFTPLLVAAAALVAGGAWQPGSVAADGFRPDARWVTGQGAPRAGGFRPIQPDNREATVPAARIFSAQADPGYPQTAAPGPWELPGYVRRSQGQFRPAASEAAAGAYGGPEAYRGRYGRNDSQFRPVRQHDGSGSRDNSAVLVGYDPLPSQTFGDSPDPLGGYRFTGGPDW